MRILIYRLHHACLVKDFRLLKRHDHPDPRQATFDRSIESETPSPTPQATNSHHLPACNQETLNSVVEPS